MAFVSSRSFLKTVNASSKDAAAFQSSANRRCSYRKVHFMTSTSWYILSMAYTICHWRQGLKVHLFHFHLERTTSVQDLCILTFLFEKLNFQFISGLLSLNDPKPKLYDLYKVKGKEYDLVPKH